MARSNFLLWPTPQAAVLSLSGADVSHSQTSQMRQPACAAQLLLTPATGPLGCGAGMLAPLLYPLGHGLSPGAEAAGASVARSSWLAIADAASFSN